MSVKNKAKQKQNRIILTILFFLLAFVWFGAILGNLCADLLKYLIATNREETNNITSAWLGIVAGYILALLASIASYFFLDKRFSNTEQITDRVEQSADFVVDSVNATVNSAGIDFYIAKLKSYIEQEDWINAEIEGDSYLVVFKERMSQEQYDIINKLTSLACRNISLACLNNKTFIESLAKADKAIVRDGKAAESFHVRALVLVAIDFEGRNPEKAIKDFTQTIDLDNKKSVYYINRALAYKEMGKHIEARSDLESAKKLDPTNLGIDEMIAKLEK
jgi:tetratricopeptide (TPR) repeat protein